MAANDMYTPEEIALFGASPEVIAAYRAARVIQNASGAAKAPSLLGGEGIKSLFNPVSFVTSNWLGLAGPSKMTGPDYGPYPAPGSYFPAITGTETGSAADQANWSRMIQENPDVLAAYTGGSGIDLGGGFILTNRGLFDTGANRVVSTPPLVPVEAPVDAGGGGGGGGSTADGGGDAGGDIGSLEPDPDLMGGSPPVTGTMPAPGPDGKPDPTKPPIPETSTRTTEEWVPIIQDWLIRFPNASEAEKQEAIQKYGVPAEAIQKAQEGVGAGGQGSGTGTGSSGSGDSTGSPVTPTQPTPQTPTLPRPGPSPAPNAGPQVTTGTGVGPGTGTGTGTGGGNGGGTGGLLGLNATRTTEMVFPELYQPKLERFTVLGNLLSNQPWRYRA